MSHIGASMAAAALALGLAACSKKEEAAPATAAIDVMKRSPWGAHACHMRRATVPRSGQGPRTEGQG